MPSVIEQYTGPFARYPENDHGDAENTRLIVIDEDGVCRIVFEGKCFDQDEFERRMGELGRKSKVGKICSS